MALIEGVEEVLYLKAVLVELRLLSSASQVLCYVDNRSLCDSLYSTKLVSDKMLRIDVAAIKQLLEQNVIQQVKWCPAEKQLADVLTKRGANPSGLLDVITSGRVELM